MAIKFNDTYIRGIAAGHLEPGEQIVAQTAGVHRPFWTFGIRYLWRTYLLIATDRRLVMVEHRKGLLYDRVEKVESIPWGQISKTAISGLFLKKSINLTFADGRPKLSLRLPGFLGPMPRTGEGAKTLVSTWERGRTLPPPAQQPLLQAAGAY